MFWKIVKAEQQENDAAFAILMLEMRADAKQEQPDAVIRKAISSTATLEQVTLECNDEATKFADVYTQKTTIATLVGVEGEV